MNKREHLWNIHEMHYRNISHILAEISDDMCDCNGLTKLVCACV